MNGHLRRREFITLLGGAAVWPVTARAQQAGVPVVGFINGATPDNAPRSGSAFRKGLSETGYLEGQNINVEYHWMAGQYERLPALIAELVRRRVAVIATPGFPDGAIAAKAATTTIPIVFGVPDNPVKLGLVASLARPGGNATGVNFFAQEVTAKRMGLLRELVPKAARVAVLVNPASPSTTEQTLEGAEEVARASGQRIFVIKADTVSEIDGAFAMIAREGADALLVSGGGFFNSRRVQLVTLAARDRLPTAFSAREYVEVGGLMSYGTNIADMFRQVGIYTGSILKGVAPADLPVLQPTKFELVVNLNTAKALGLEVPPTLLARADEVIE
jgi:putative tryptophan/tyrosine transport system substrate-binding protein